MSDIKLNFKIDVHNEEVQGILKATAVNALEEAIGEIESQTKRNTKVKTGKTKGSWQHIVNEDDLEAYVGSNYENAIWEEFGTGIYAQNGNGRKTAWVYTPDGGKTFYKTHGKKPRRMLQNAFNSTKYKIEKYFKKLFRSLK